MKLQHFHFHLAYVGNARFQLTLTHIEKPTKPLIEIMTVGDLQRSIRAMKPGATCIRFAITTIDCDGCPHGLREYFKKVYDSYVQAKSEGRDLDVELRNMQNSPDPTDGSGGLSLNLGE